MYVYMHTNEWGNAVWFLLHTLSHKLLPVYSSHAREALPILIRVATHLPCDDCSAHARRMLVDLQRRPLRGRADLVEFWREAHNTVNRRLGKPEFSLRECIEQYSRADTSLVVRHFRNVIGSVRTGERGLAEGWRRRRVMEAFDNYLASHAYMYAR
jgi:hypothetical protein